MADSKDSLSYPIKSSSVLKNYPQMLTDNEK